MSSQTKLGFITVILLVGCIFAIPHFRHPLADPSEASDISPVDPELSLRRKKSPNGSLESPVASSKKTSKPSDATLAVGIAESPNLTGAHSPQSQPHSAPTSPRHEQWKFPPMAELREPMPQGTGTLGSRTSSEFAELSQRPRPLRVPLPSENTAERSRLSRENHHPPASWEGERLVQATPAGRPDAPLPRMNDLASSPRGRTASIGRQQFVEREPGMLKHGEVTLHRIVNGDTLESLAMQYCGDPQKAILIFDLNRNVLVNPAILPLGSDLKIPVAKETRVGR